MQTRLRGKVEASGFQRIDSVGGQPWNASDFGIDLQPDTIEALREASKIAQRNPTTGNEVQLLADGNATFLALLEAIATAFITQAAVWEKVCDVIGKPEWKTDPDFATPKARLPRLNQIFGAIEDWTMTKTKFEVMEICNPHDIPVGPILSMKEIAEDEGLRATGTIVEVDHPERGPYLTVGMPIKMSDSPVEVTRSPLLGEHTAEILSQVLGYDGEDLARVIGSGAVGEVRTVAAE
jgi:hypothetical protein